jgi:protein-S-isoprenylcysteine O-methyltransferase Ste14
LSLANALAIVALQMRPGNARASKVMEAVCPYPSANVKTIAGTDTVFMIGITTMLIACGLRVWCYATLGRLFTYRVAVIPGHKLITSGPYAYARHPSYTGVFLMLAGAAITFLLSPNSYIHECGIMMTPWKWLVVYWCTCVCFSIISLVNRGKVEDKLMMDTFGKDWHNYYTKVPYKFIPFVM